MTSTQVTSIAQSDAVDLQRELTRLCKASADELRLTILRVLQRNAYAVQELCEILDVKQSSMSHHLKLLSQAGLIESKREGNTVFYRRSAHALHDVFQSYQTHLCHSVDALSLSDTIQQHMRIIAHKRSEQSLRFFTEHADQFQSQQDLIAEYPQYGDTVASLLSSLPTSHAFNKALEVGPGQGQFLTELCTRYEHVTALDNNAAMLESAQTALRGLNFQNIDWVHGDTQHASLAALNADLIVLNMVLHHTPSPADIFNDLRGAINDDGVLIITDLCRHDQDWAKDSCGDLWLGFDTDELTHWAAQAQFEKHQTLYLSLLNGFRIQICLFHPIRSVT
ncbi:MAG: metalloregulator ArsR/SmtB family transcription factor [Pseudomonadota bacterium]